MAKLYAIVGAMERARIMLEARTPYLQLRFKEDPLAPHHQEIRDWARAYPDTRIIINDDLDAAVKVGAWGAHLGQEDLDRYTPAQVRGAPLMVGISTHSPAEIQRALDYGAAMLGFGPIFPTGSKDTGFAPQGVERLRSVVTRSHLPIIAIGGIDSDTVASVAATGVSMIAMISYLDRFTEPEEIATLARRMDRFPTMHQDTH